MACRASLTTYSRSIGPTAAKPSPPRANGVRPEPFKCRSQSRPLTSVSSPSRSARPSPRRGLYPPNWCPAYACATGLAPAGTRLPTKSCSPSVLLNHSGSRPSSTASGSLSTSRRGSVAFSACHGIAISASSRAKQSPRITVCAGATPMPSRVLTIVTDRLSQVTHPVEEPG